MPSDPGFLTARTDTATVTIDPAIGNIRDLRFHDDGREISPLHTAHWVGATDDPKYADLPPVDRHLSGDFICAPFGNPDDPNIPPHGWGANSKWTTQHQTVDTLNLRLDRAVKGAMIDKELRLVPGHRALYQTHRVTGGQGALTLSHHPMVHMAQGGRMFFSPKRAAISPDTPLESGRNRLQCPARSTDLTDFPGTGGAIDLTRYPQTTGHEDFVTLIESDLQSLGWTAILRDEENDIIVILKDPRVLPVTMLWFSNGGRDYFPWQGRHTGVLGVEDGIAAGAAGMSAVTLQNPIRDEGVETALILAPNTTHTIRHAIVALARANGWDDVQQVNIADNQLHLRSNTGADISVPFDGSFFPDM